MWKGTPSYGAGEVGQAFDFGTPGNEVEVADSPALDVTAALSLDAWIKPRSAGSVDGTTFIALKGDNFARNTQSYGLVWAPATVVFRLGSPSDIDQIEAPIPPGRFSHVAGTYDGHTMTLYVDGQRVGSKVSTLGALQATSQPFVIGSSLRQGSEQASFDGLVDELDLFDHALTADQVKAIADAGAAGKCPAGS